ncbi:family 16 glycosylhydrolase, partial [bacterium]|nr:family 16 glycosylhydrolase [bacterium]
MTKVNLSDYRLVWSDGFNGNAVNTDEWHYRTDNSWGSTQLPANVSEADGLLRIDLRKQDAGGKHYTGGGIITKRHFEFGYYETRMRMPASPGWHTSFWMAGFDNMKSPTGASGGLQELDCCEQDSFEQSSYTHNIHMRKPAYLTGWTRIRTPNLTQGFHVWGCEFTPRHVRYFFDGQMVGVYD